MRAGLEDDVLSVIESREDDDMGAETEEVMESVMVLGNYPREKVRGAIDRLEKHGYIYTPDGGDHYRSTFYSP